MKSILRHHAILDRVALAGLLAWLVICLALFSGGCAFNKVDLANHTGTNTTTAVVRSYAIWPATVDLAKQKASAGKTLSIGTEGLEASGGGTNIAVTLDALTRLLQTLPK